jgi:TRAP transporter TAXI family solute receptor
MAVSHVFGWASRLFGGVLFLAIIHIPMSPKGHTQDEIKLRLGTATPGGGFPVYGAAFIAALRDADPGLVIEAVNTKGSTENVPMLEAGSLDIALVQGEVVHEVLRGVGRPPADLKIVTAMYATAGMFVVRADSPYRTIADLKGRPVAFGASGSGLVILARYVLDGLGLDQQTDFRAIFLERAGDGPAMVLDGRAAALWGGGSGWPGFMAVARAEKGARFIVPDGAEIARILAKHDFLKPLTLPAGSFPGQDHPVQSVGSWSFVMSRPDLDEAVAYRLAKATHGGEAAIAARLPQAAETGGRNDRTQHGQRRR